MTSELGSWSPMNPDEVAHLLGRAGVPWWIAGGWAIDLHLGRRTRVHDDIDVLVLRPDLPRLRERLGGWDLHAADPPGTLRPWPVREKLPLGVHDIWCRPSPTADWCLQLMVDDLADDLADDSTDDLADDSTDDLADDSTDDLADDSADDLADDSADDLADDSADDLADDSADDLADDSADDLANDPADDGSGEGQKWVYRRDTRIRRAWRTLSGPASSPQRSVLAPEVQLLYKSTTPREKDKADFTHIAGVLDSSQRTWLTEALQLTDATNVWIEQLQGLTTP